MELLIALTFPADHPYGHTTIGSMDDLNAATLADVQAFFRDPLPAQQRRAAPSSATSTPEDAFDAGGDLLRAPAGRGEAGQARRRAAAAR